jgi:hypothetical protein
MRRHVRLVSTVLLYTFTLQTTVFANYPLAPRPIAASAIAVPLHAPLASAAPLAQVAASTPMWEDLRSWTTVAPAGQGDWQMSASGMAVTQTMSGNRPTLLLSPADAINTTLRAKVKVLLSSTQNDSIGFAFGVKAPLSSIDGTNHDLWLIDW